MFDSEVVLARKDGVVFQGVSDDLVLVDMEGGGYYSLNTVGARIWELSDGSRTTTQIVETICEEYEGPEETIRQDVLELLEDLFGEHLLVRAQPSAE